MTTIERISEIREKVGPLSPELNALVIKHPITADQLLQVLADGSSVQPLSRHEGDHQDHKDQ